MKTFEDLEINTEHVCIDAASRKYSMLTSRIAHRHSVTEFHSFNGHILQHLWDKIIFQYHMKPLFFEKSEGFMFCVRNEELFKCGKMCI